MYNSIVRNQKEVIRHLLQNGFQLIARDNGVNEFRNKEISFYFVKNDIIIEFNPDEYFHVYQQLSYDLLFAIFHFCRLENNSRAELINQFTHKNFTNIIKKNYISTYKRRIRND